MARASARKPTGGGVEPQGIGTDRRSLGLGASWPERSWGIGGRCGFATIETYHRSFRRVVSVTPNAYRQRFPMAAAR